MAMVDREIKRAIEACRPGSDDVSLPELSQLAEAIENDPAARDLFDRSQRCDAAIGAAFRDVAVPDGLADRLLSVVGQRDSESTTAATSATESIPRKQDHAQPELTAAPPRSRRHWLRVSVGVAAALALSLVAALVIVQWEADEPVLGDGLRQEFLTWEAQITREGWQRDFTEPRLAERPLDPTIKSGPRRWCQIETRYDRSTIVYDLAPPGERYAYLFCMRIKAASSKLPQAPPPKPYAPTGRTCLGAWRRGDMVYVLVVDGDKARYMHFLGSLIQFGLATSVPPSLT
jgi:hypothetical protein